MSQGIFSTIIPSTTSGNQLAVILNDFKDAVVSGFSGTSRPANLQAGGYWIDVTDDASDLWYFKLYDGTQDILVFTLNLATGTASIANADSLFQVSKISEDSVGPIFRAKKSRVSTGGQVKVGDTIGEYQFYGTRDDSVATLQARIKSISTNDVTSSAQGAYISFEITTTGAASVSEVMRLVDGKVAIGHSSPDNPLHVLGSGSRVERRADDAVGVKHILKKKRVAGSGQILNADVLGVTEYYGADDTGVEVNAAQIEVSARQNFTNSAHGSQITVRNKKTGQTSFTDQIIIDEVVNVKTSLLVDGDFQVNGTTTYANTTNMDIKDANVTLNKGGNQASANSNKSGFKVEMSDATHAQIGYDSTKASKFVAGNVGSESEIITATHTQTMTNKTLTSPAISGSTFTSPAQLDVKKDTEANLTTYATTATNGQWCFATDTKVMYQVIDNALVPAGAGGGGISLNWNDSGNAPVLQWVDGFNLGDFDNISNQELYAILTVPSSYRAGKPIKLKSGNFFTPSTSGNVYFRTQAALIQATSILGTYPNIRTSSNSQVAVSGVANTSNAIGDLDLTDSAGLINGVAVAPGHKIRIRLYRDNTNETSGASGNARLVVASFEPTFS